MSSAALAWLACRVLAYFSKVMEAVSSQLVQELLESDGKLRWIYFAKESAQRQQRNAGVQFARDSMLWVGAKGSYQGEHLGNRQKRQDF